LTKLLILQNLLSNESYGEAESPFKGMWLESKLGSNSSAQHVSERLKNSKLYFLLLKSTKTRPRKTLIRQLWLALGIPFNESFHQVWRLTELLPPLRKFPFLLLILLMCNSSKRKPKTDPQTIYFSIDLQTRNFLVWIPCFL